jgi:hypothetical protein
MATPRARQPSPKAATTARAKGRTARFEMPRGEADTRTLMHLISGFLNRVDVLRRKAYFGDTDQAIVAGIVGVGSIDHLVYQPEFRQAYGDVHTIVGTDHQRGVNAFSIAQATGIPRETVRRKLKDLVARGVILEKERGLYILTPGFIQRPENIAAINEVTGHALQMMNACLALGVVRLVESEEEP